MELWIFLGGGSDFGGGGGTGQLAMEVFALAGIALTPATVLAEARAGR